MEEPRYCGTPLRPGDDQIRLFPTHYFHNLIPSGAYSWKLPDPVPCFFKFGRFLREQFLSCFLYDRITEIWHDMYQQDDDRVGVLLDSELLDEELPRLLRCGRAVRCE